MFRPLRSSIHRLSTEGKYKEFVRHKVVRPSSMLKPAERIKLYNRENKELFGPLIETNKQRKQRTLKEAKNSSTVKDQNNSSSSSDSTLKEYGKDNAVLTSYLKSIQLPLENLKRKMVWSNSRNAMSLFGVMLNTVSHQRGFKTYSVCHAAKSSPAQPGYVSEDRILQIKQHQNDFAKQYPSVTLILNKTMTEESRLALEKWKQEKIAELGAEEFEKFYQAQMALGTKFHSTLKNYFTQPRSQLRIEKDVEGVWTSVSDVLKRVSAPKAIESNVIHPVLKYRGVFDAIADYEDKPTVIEWKKSDRPRKSILLTYDNPVQLAAYFGAVCNDLNYKHFNVRDALLVIAYTDGSKADTYHLSMDKLRDHWAQWLSRLENYMKKHSNNSEKILKGGKRLFEEDLGNLQ